MSAKNWVIRQSELAQKFQRLEEECNCVIRYIQKVVDKGKRIIDKQDAQSDQMKYLSSFAVSCKELDKLLNSVVYLNCNLEILTCDDGSSHENVTKTNCEEHVDPLDSSFEEFCDAVEDIRCSSSGSSSFVLAESGSNESEHILPFSSHITSSSVPEDIPQSLPEHAPSSIPENIPDYLPEDVPSPVPPVYVLSSLPENVPFPMPSPVFVHGPTLHTGLPEHVSQSPLKVHIPPSTLKPGSILEMAFSHGVGPWNFWLHPYSTKDVDIICGKMLTKHQSGGMKTIVSLPDIGDHLSAFDGYRFFRGEVSSFYSNIDGRKRVILSNIDSGETKDVDFSNIWELDEDVKYIPVQAINCRLKGNWGDCTNWGKGCTQLFEGALIDRLLVVTICEIQNGNPPQYIVESDLVDINKTGENVDMSKWILDTVIPKLEVLKQVSDSPEFQVLQQSLDPFSMYNVDFVDTLEEQFPSSSCAQSSLHLLRKESENQTDSHLKMEHLVQSEEAVKSDSALCMNSQQSETSVDEHCDLENQQLPAVDVSNSQNVETSVDCCDSTRRTSLQNHYAEVLAGSSDLEDVHCNMESCVEGLSYSQEQAQETALSECEAPQEERNETNKEVCFTTDHKELNLISQVMLLKQDYSDSVGKEYVVMLSYTVTAGEFYVHIVCETNTHIDSLKADMTKFYSVSKVNFSSKEMAKIHIGKYCACLYPEDNMWYRAEVVDWMDASLDSVCVLYVDYGNQMVVKLHMIQPLWPTFAKYPIMAQLCHLAYVCPPTSNSIWPEESTYAFNKLVVRDDVQRIIVMESSCNKDSLAVLLFNPKLSKEVSVNDCMIDSGLANELPANAPIVQQKVNEDLDAWNPMEEDFYSAENVPEYDDEDACLAVSGYIPKDESRVCKFFAKSGNCYKGAGCRKEHIFTHKDGWTTDREAVFTHAFNSLTLPNEGRMVKLTVTEVVGVKSFFAHVDSGIIHSRNVSSDPEDEQETLDTLHKFINTPANVKQFRRLSVTPALGQLVLAQYSHDQLWYRACVIDTDNDEGIVETFFVDYGNKESVSEKCVRDIEARFLHLPFQAVECFIANIERKDSVDDKERLAALSFVQNLILHKTLQARIVTKTEELGQLEVLIQNHVGIDIGSMIVENNFGLPITFVRNTKNNFDMPKIFKFSPSYKGFIPG